MPEEKDKKKCEIILTHHSLRCIGFGLVTGWIMAGVFAFSYLAWQSDKHTATTLLMKKADCDPLGDINIRVPSGGEFNCFTKVTRAKVRRPKHKR